MRAVKTALVWLAVYVVSFGLDSAHVYDRVSSGTWTFLAGLWVGVMWAAVGFAGWVWSFVKEEAVERGDPKPRLRDLFFPKEKET